MKSSSDKVVFWCLIGVQAACSQFIIWNGVPVYNQLLSDIRTGASAKQIELALSAAVIMQVGYWLAFRLKQQLHFRRHVLLGHVLIWIGELSLFFIAALATILLFQCIETVKFEIWKFFVLAVVLFAVACYKHMLMSLGDELIKGEREIT